MACFNPELVSIMRAALEDVMMRVPADQATSTIKVHLAEVILRTAAQGETSYDALIAAATGQIQSVLALFN